MRRTGYPLKARTCCHKRGLHRPRSANSSTRVDAGIAVLNAVSTGASGSSQAPGTLAGSTTHPTGRALRR